jgi:hypothetical protein
MADLLSVLCGFSPRTLRFRIFVVVIDNFPNPVFQHDDMKVDQESHLQQNNLRCEST